MSSKEEAPLIFIIDDIAKNLQLLGSVLRKEGYRVAATADSRQVLQSAIKLKPEVILLDVMMPELNGFEVCKQLKEHPETKEIPVIFLTGKTEVEDIVQGFELGGSDYITKPFKIPELLVRVKTQVELRHSRNLIMMQNEQLQELNDTKDTFFSIIAHDLKGPLHGILNVGKIIKDDFDAYTPDELRMMADILLDSTKGANKLLDNLLQWARLQTGRLELELQTVRIKDLVEEVLVLLNSTAADKHIQLTILGEEGIELQTDANIIQTILRNLIANAIKFSPKKAEVVVQWSQDPDATTLQVIDKGVGMTKEQMKELFKFKPGKRGTKGEKSTGLGLSLSKQLADRLGVTLSVESKPGSGTSFGIIIPKPH